MRTPHKKDSNLPVHVLDPDFHRPPVGLQLLHLGQLHDRPADVAETLRRQIRAGDVLDEGAKVDARVLLGVAVGSYSRHVSTKGIHDLFLSRGRTGEVAPRGGGLNLRKE